MKFFLFFLLSLLAVFGNAEYPDCGCSKTLTDTDCTGFKVRKESNWDDFRVAENGQCVKPVDADTVDFNDNYLCCSDSPDDCCEDYPAGFYAGFGIGLGGIVFMVLYAVYLCFGSSSEPKVEGP